MHVGHCVSECVASLSTCQLTILGYVCVCVAGYTGDGTVSGSGCTGESVAKISGSLPRIVYDLL